MKKILIIGASILQLPMIRRAKELGFRVGVIDYNPDAIGVSYADDFFEVSTIDVNGIVNVARMYRPDGVTTLATDMPVRGVAAACKTLALPGISPESAFMATNKEAMLRAFERARVPHPQYKVVYTREEFDLIKTDVTFPAITKPIDQSGSRGIMLANSLAELEVSYDYSIGESYCGVVVIEEFMFGSEVSVEIITLSENDIRILAVTDKLTTGAPHFVEMGHSQPSKLGAETISAINDVAVRATRAVGIKRGPAHVEIIITKDGPKVVELGARMGGDCITTHLVPLSTGIDMVEATIRCAFGMNPDLTQKFNRGAAVRYFKAPVGTIKSIANVKEAEAIPGIQQISFIKGVGEQMSEIHESGDRLGFVVAQAATVDEAIIICEKALAMVDIVVD